MNVGWKILAALLLAVAAVVGFSAFSAHLVAKGDAAGYERAQNEYRAAENKALKQAAADKARLETEIEKVSHDAREKTAAADAANAAAAAAGRRLRNALAALGRGQPGQPATAAGGSASADPSSNLRAEVQRRLDEAADGIAGFADKSRIAGLACERAYDAVN